MKTFFSFLLVIIWIGCNGQMHTTIYYQKNTLFTSEYQAILDKAAALGYSVPNQTVQIAQNDFIRFLKNNSLWSKFDILHVFLNLDATLGNFSTINWKDPNNYQCTLSGTAPTYGSYGWTGGTNKYLNTNWNPSTNGVNYTLNNASLFASVIESTSNTGGILGLSNASLVNRCTIEPRYTDDKTYYVLNGAATGIVVPTYPDMAGLWIVSRTASNAAAFYKDGLSQQSTSNSPSGLPNNTLYYLAENNNGAANYNSNTIAMGGAASGFSTSEASLFAAGWKSYLTSVLMGNAAAVTFPTASTNSDFTSYNNAVSQLNSLISQPQTYNSLGTSIMSGFIGGAIIKGRWLYCVPYTPGTATRFLKIDTFTGSQTLFGPTLTIAGWTGAVPFGTDDRYIFCGPHNATVVAIIDTMDDSVTFWDTTGQVAGESGNLTGGTKWDCGVRTKDGTKIVIAPHTDNRVFIFNTSTYAISFVTTSCIGSAYIGGTNLPDDDKIVFAPFAETRALVFDSQTNAVDLTTYTGFSSFATKFAGAYLAPNKKIFFAPHSYGKVSGIDPTNHTIIADFGSFTQISQGWIGGKILADGNLYCFPSGATTILKINTTALTTSNLTSPFSGVAGVQINAYGQLWANPYGTIYGWYGYKLPAPIDYNWGASIYSNKY